MSHLYQSIPEFAARHSAASLIRLPPGADVPLTPRVRRLIDSPAFRRLGNISQLGLVRLVYPGAGHSRFEHSLGVYGVALEFLNRLSSDRRFCELVSPAEVERFLVAALLHDIGHWPYCHPVEDVQLPGLASHETLAREALTSGPLGDLLKTDWKLDPAGIADLIEGRVASPGERIICSMLSGPIDVDKIDYLARDSLHCGVPYGRNFDQARLIASLCLSEASDSVAVTEKGKTAAELMVFARYVMFSEVYWHHAARSATAMLQRAIFELQDQLDWNAIYRSTDVDFPQLLSAAAEGSTAEGLVQALFGDRRLLHKRVAQYSLFESPEVYRLLARRPYSWLVDCSKRVAEAVAGTIGEVVSSGEILFDAPPVKLEVQFDVEVFAPKTSRYRALGDVSPVVKTLAREQFDDYVKRVRVFASPRVARALAGRSIDDLIATAATT